MATTGDGIEASLVALAVRDVRLLGGRTGSGKTEVLQALAQLEGGAAIDLEGLANHRGSAFGGIGLGPQPTQLAFEEGLLAALQQLAPRHEHIPVWLEAESPQIGRCRLPDLLIATMRASPRVEITRSVDERVAHLCMTYDTGFADRQQLVAATRKLARRLGPTQTAAAVAAIEAGNLAAAAAAMLEYYDRMYDHGRRHHPSTVIALDGTNATFEEIAARLLDMHRTAS